MYRLEGARVEKEARADGGASPVERSVNSVVARAIHFVTRRGRRAADKAGSVQTDDRPPDERRRTRKTIRGKTVKFPRLSII